jgi:hypothetical protein
VNPQISAVGEEEPPAVKLMVRRVTGIAVPAPLVLNPKKKLSRTFIICPAVVVIVVVPGGKEERLEKEKLKQVTVVALRLMVPS